MDLCMYGVTNETSGIDSLIPLTPDVEVARRVARAWQAVLTEYQYTLSDTVTIEDYTEAVEPTFDRFDICEAASVFAADYNDGGFTALPTDKRSRNIDARLRALQFRPSPMIDGTFDNLSENGKAWYRKWETAFTVERAKVQRQSFADWCTAHTREELMERS